MPVVLRTTCALPLVQDIALSVFVAPVCREVKTLGLALGVLGVLAIVASICAAPWITEAVFDRVAWSGAALFVAGMGLHLWR